MLSFNNLHLYLCEVISFVVTIVKHFATFSRFKTFVPVSLFLLVPYCVVHLIYSVRCWYSTVLEASNLYIIVRWEGFQLSYGTWLNAFCSLLVRDGWLNPRFTAMIMFFSLNTSCSVGLCFVKNLFLWLDVCPKLLGRLHVSFLHQLFCMLRGVRLIIIQSSCLKLSNFTAMFVFIYDLILQVVLIMGSVHSAAIYCFKLALSRFSGNVDLWVVKWV